MLACRLMERNLITGCSSRLLLLLVLQLLVEIEVRPQEQGHITHMGILPGARSLSQLCQSNIHTTRPAWHGRIPSHKHMSSSCPVAAFFLRANLSFRVFQNELSTLSPLPTSILQSPSLSSLSFISLPSLLLALRLPPSSPPRLPATSLAPCTPSACD